MVFSCDVLVYGMLIYTTPDNLAIFNKIKQLDVICV